MPEICRLVCRYNSLEELDRDLSENEFREIPRAELDVTIRRECERPGPGRGWDRVAFRQFDLVLALAKIPIEHEGVVFGMWSSRKDGVREYVGVHRRKFQVVVVNHDFVERRRSRYEKQPLPQESEARGKHVRQLMLEVLEKWSGPSEDTLGVTYARMYMHVADYANIEVEQARELVDAQLKWLQLIGRVERTEGDCWRIPPKLIRDREKLGDKGVLN
jgi:hypothetical protein